MNKCLQSLVCLVEWNQAIFSLNFPIMDSKESKFDSFREFFFIFYFFEEVQTCYKKCTSNNDDYKSMCLLFLILMYVAATTKKKTVKKKKTKKPVDEKDFTLDGNIFD